MITKPRAVIFIENMNRIGKLLIQHEALGRGATFLLSQDIEKVVTYPSAVTDFLKSNDQPELMQRIIQMPDTTLLRKVIDGFTDKLHSAELCKWLVYATDLDTLKHMCNRTKDEEKGMYRELPDEIATPEAAKLLLRAAEAGYLDIHFQPTGKVRWGGLRLIAYAVSTILKLPKRSRFGNFDRLWSNGKGRVTRASVPVRKLETEYKEIVELYPEVDFSELIAPRYELVFNTLQPEEKILSLYTSLKNRGYIDPKTTKKQFLGVFGLSANHTPVLWIREQRLLGFFVYFALRPMNRDFWAKAAARFTLEGISVNQESLKSGWTSILKDHEKAEDYEPMLYAIAQDFACR